MNFVRYSFRFQLMLSIFQNFSCWGTWKRIEKYIASNNRKLENGKTVNSVKSEIDRGAKGCYTNQIIADYPGYRYPVWAFVELIPFGTFNHFLLFIANKDRDKKLKSRYYQLQSVKALRNACGHNNCIIDDLKGGTPSHEISRNVKNALRAVGYSDITLSTKLRNCDDSLFASSDCVSWRCCGQGRPASPVCQSHVSECPLLR